MIKFGDVALGRGGYGGIPHFWKVIFRNYRKSGMVLTIPMEKNSHALEKVGRFLSSGKRVFIRNVAISVEVNAPKPENTELRLYPFCHRWTGFR